MINQYELQRLIYREMLYPFLQRSFRDLNPGAKFFDAYYLRALCDMLERVARGEVKRLILALPPRCLKSELVSIVFPAWILGRDPTKKIICASYNGALAETFSLKSRQLMGADWYKATFQGTQLHSLKNTANDFWTSKNGFRAATSVGGTMTGTGGDMIIIDDPMKASDAHSAVARDNVWGWETGTVSSRLNSQKDGIIIVVAQRLHEDDLIGRLIAKGGWELLVLPAIATEHQELSLGKEACWARAPGDLLHPERLGEKELAQLKIELGSADFEAQYQQRPVLPGGLLVKTEWFGTYEGTPTRDDYEAIVQSWDTAAVPGQNNDWCVCTTWGLIGKHVDLLDVHREQHIYPSLLQAAKALHKKWKPKLIVIEKAMTGISLLQDLRSAGIGEAQGMTPKGDKVQRMSAQSAKIEEGQVRLPKQAPWKQKFLSETAAFPNGNFDDQVDSLSQVLRALDRRPKEIYWISRYKK